MPGLDDYKSSTGDNSFKQSGYFVNYDNALLYLQTGKILGRAMFYSHQGIRGQQEENKYRAMGLASFMELINISIWLPAVNNKLNGVPFEKKGFKDVQDLRNKIVTAIKEKTPSSEIMKWWDCYAKILVDVGLIKIYTQEDSPFNKFRR